MIIFCKRLVVHLGRSGAMVILDTHLLRTSSPKGTPSDRYFAGFPTGFWMNFSSGICLACLFLYILDWVLPALSDIVRTE